MKKNILLLFYLLVLTVALILKEPASAVEESTLTEAICRDALTTKLSDENKDIVSGAIMIAQQLRPSYPQVNLYHIFLAAMTEVRVDGAPITYTNPNLLIFLREQKLLGDFQNFLLNNLGSNRTHLDSLFEKKSDGTFILNWNTSVPFDGNHVSNFIYTFDVERLLEAMNQNKQVDTKNDFFLYTLEFDNPIRKFFFDRLTEHPTFLERTLGRLFRWLDPTQERARRIYFMYPKLLMPELIYDLPKKAIPTNPIIAFDLINRISRNIANDSDYTNPSPYFSIDDLWLYPGFFDSDFERDETPPIWKILKRWQPLDDSNRFITFRKNHAHVYGKIIGFSEDHTSLVIESLDGQKYVYHFSITSRFLFMKKFKKVIGDAFLPFYVFSDVLLASRRSKKLFDIYEEIRGLTESPIPLNQHTGQLSIDLFRELFNLITLNNYLRKHYPELEARQVSLSDFDEARHFVSFLNSQGERVPGKLIDVNDYSVIVEDLDGHRSRIEGEALNRVSQDETVRLLFQYPHIDSVDTPEIDGTRIVQRQGEGGLSYAGLEMSGDPAQDVFRRALIAGRFEGDERFISFFDEGEKKLAKVFSWEGKTMRLQIYEGNTDYRLTIVPLPLINPTDPRFLKDDSIFSTAAVSQTAKDYFERINSFLNRRNIRLAAGEDYQFLSHSISITKEHNGRTIEMKVDLTDPYLRKWMRKATDIIKEKTEITPGAQKLTAAQRIQIYRVFYEDIVPLVEMPIRERYAYFHDLIYNWYYFEGNSKQNEFQFLGHVLDTKSAICTDLSAFGVVLLSEYGLHTRYMQTSPKMIEILKNEGMYGHAWIGVQREDGSLEFIDTNGRIFWSTNLRLLREGYEGDFSHSTDDELLSLSEEHTLMIPPSLPE